ncbi:MAG: helix-turn-helix transcriptional regulator [Muribaculaceae bacterium]
MLFAEKIKRLREEQQLPQRQLAAALEIDTATYCKIEKGDRKARREQIAIIADMLKCEKEELLEIWLADKVYDIVKEEEHSDNVLSIVAEKVVEYTVRNLNKSNIDGEQ